MRGQVIDGLYKGCAAHQLKNNTFCIQDSEGRSIPVSENTALSVADISHNYPGFGAKTYLVRWKQDAVSVLQFFPELESGELYREDPPAAGRKRGRLLVITLVAVLLCIALAAAWYMGAFHRHSWMDATCEAPRTCRGCGETEGKVLEHTPGDWTVLKKGSYGSYGTQQQSCTQCGLELASRTYLPDAYSGNLYVCSADEFSRRLNLWLLEAGIPWEIVLEDTEGEMLTLQLMENDRLQAVICFVDQDYTTVLGDGPGRLNASSVCVAFEEGSASQEARLLPALVACCNNDLDLAGAEALVKQIQSHGKFEQNGVRYHWGTVDGLDYFFLGFDSVPDSLRKLPSVGGASEDTDVTNGSILYTSSGQRRDAAAFANAYFAKAHNLSLEFGYGNLTVDLLESLDDYAYALRQNDSSEYTVLAFACDSELLTANGAFDEIYLISSIDDEAQVTAYAYHTASMVLLLDPGMGTLQDCAVFLNEMISEMDDEGKSLREENGITYYMILGEDGYVSLVISF